MGKKITKTFSFYEADLEKWGKAAKKSTRPGHRVVLTRWIEEKLNAAAEEELKTKKPENG